MILRVIILVLTLSNLGYFGWTEGWFDGIASAKSVGDREPGRLARQVNPEAMRLSAASATTSGGSSPAVAASASAAGHVAAPSPEPGSNGSRSGSTTGNVVVTAASGSIGVVAPSPPASGSTLGNVATSASPASNPVPAIPASAAKASALACVESGPYQPKEAQAAEAVLKSALPAGAWTNVVADRPGVWMLFMGRFVDNDTRRRKEGELSRRNAPFEEVEAPPEFARGLSLGRFPSKADADRGMAELNRLGVHTARIVVFTPPLTLHTFRVDKADPAAVDKVKSLKLTLPVVPCAAASPP